MSETVTDNEVKEPVEQVAIEESQEQVEQQEVIEETREEQKVPLSALQKERKKRQDLELENRYLKEYAVPRNQETPVENDDLKYEPITKGEMAAQLAKERTETLRMAEERIWIKQNPEKAAVINEKLPEFLKQRPNLATAIDTATNRYEEAWELMDKLTPKQKMALKPTSTVKKEAPNSPSSVPKASNLNQTVDFMSMNDAEFRAWRQSVVKK
jgi:hypothetical protein